MIFIEINFNISLITIVHVCLFLYMQNIFILCFLVTFTSFHIANVHEWVDYMLHMFSTYDKIRVSENTWRPQQEISPSSLKYTQVLYVLHFPRYLHMICDFLCHHDVVKNLALLAICAGNPTVIGGPPLANANDAELWCFLWFVPKTPSHSLWRHCNVYHDLVLLSL